MADASAPKDVALDELEEVGAMAVDMAAEEEGKSQEEGTAGTQAADEQGDFMCVFLAAQQDKSPRPLSKKPQG